MTKILVVNQPLNNRGDESAHKALIRAILHFVPNSEIQVLFIGCNRKSISQFCVSDSRVTYANIPTLKGFIRNFLLRVIMFFPFVMRFHPTGKRLLPLYNDADVVLCAPGGVCMGGFQNWNHIFLLMFAKYLNKPVIYYGRSIGPFPQKTFLNKLFKKYSVDLLNYFTFLSLRDAKSANLANSLNIKYELTVDTAFLESPCCKMPPDVIKQLNSKPYIVFVPNKLIWHFGYRDKVSLNSVLSFYKRIVDIIKFKYPGHNILMLPQTYNYDDDCKRDINFFYELKKYVSDEKIIVLPDTFSSDIQQTIISKADCLVGARYHSVVFAINQAIPFVALSYEHKISGLLEVLHKTELMVDITSTFDSDENMQKSIDDFISALNLAHHDIESQQIAKKIAQDCFKKFVKSLNESLKNAE